MRYKPEEHGALDGVLVWAGMRESQQGESYREYVIRQADTGAMFSVPERAGLRDLRRAKLNSRVYVEPTDVRELDNGHKMQRFIVIVENLGPLPDEGRGAGRSNPPSPDAGPAGSEGVPF
jgi:hypothetical protein